MEQISARMGLLVFVLVAFVLLVVYDSNITGFAVDRLFERRHGDYFGDYFNVFFEVVAIDFSKLNDGVSCAVIAKEVLSEVLMAKPDGLAGFESDSVHDFASYAFSYPNTLGKIDFVKGDFVNGDSLKGKVFLSLEKKVRELYGLGYVAVKIDVFVEGRLKQDVFWVSNGYVKTENLNCSFS